MALVETEMNDLRRPHRRVVHATEERLKVRTAPVLLGNRRKQPCDLVILLGATPDPDHTAHVLLAPLAAEHVTALLPELGEQRMRSDLIRLAALAVEWPHS